MSIMRRKNHDHIQIGPKTVLHRIDNVPRKFLEGFRVSSILGFFPSSFFEFLNKILMVLELCYFSAFSFPVPVIVEYPDLSSFPLSPKDTISFENIEFGASHIITFQKE